MRAMLVAMALMPWAVCRADEPEVASGPKQGDKVPELKVFAAAGEITDKDLDFADERKEKPTVYFFIQAEKFTRPMNKFMKTLDGELGAIDDNAGAVAVWLTEDVDKIKGYLPRIQMSVKYEKTALTVFPGEKSGPQGWGINVDAHITAVVANKGKVVASYGYMSVNDTDVPKIRDLLKKAVGK
jgi:hypothetical protein